MTDLPEGAATDATVLAIEEMMRGSGPLEARQQEEVVASLIVRIRHEQRTVNQLAQMLDDATTDSAKRIADLERERDEAQAACQSLAIERGKLRAERDEARQQLSEVIVSDVLDADVADIPILRGSPNLAAYIQSLRDAIERQTEAGAEEITKLRAALGNAVTVLNDHGITDVAQVLEAILLEAGDV